MAQRRLLSPDLARGMMLLFIAIANVSIYLWGRPTSGVSAHLANESAWDAALTTGVIVFIDGHVYPMFAFLFGYGISQFSFARIGSGLASQAVSRMLLRRHLWLLVFGAVHALLLFAGDILGAYAVAGLALSGLLLYGSARLAKILLWVLGSLVAAGMLGTMLLTGALGLLLPQEAFSLSSSAEDFALADEWSTADLMSGFSNYWLAMLVRFGLWLASTLGAVGMLIVPFIVLLGGISARYRWLEGRSQRWPLGIIAAVGVAVGVLGSVPAALNYLGVGPQNMLWSASTAALAQTCGIAGGIGYAALFGYIGRQLSAHGASKNVSVRAVAAVGKRSLSFYLLQSVIFAPLLAAWGLGFGESITSSGAYLLALGVWLASVVLAYWLERANRLGPAELLLRRLTYGRDEWQVWVTSREA